MKNFKTETKKLAAFKRRIDKANKALTVMGDVLLCIEIEQMKQAEPDKLAEIYVYCAERGTTYPELTKAVFA